MTQKETIQVRVPPKLRDILEAEAKANGISLSEFVRHILIQRYMHVLPEEGS